MQQYAFWEQQSADKPKYPDILWNKPEQRSRAGKLGIIGGNKLGFSGVAEGYSMALKTGAGEVRVLLPAVLKKTIPPVITDTVFAPNNTSGGLSRDAYQDMKALSEWGSGMLLIGDAGRSSETAIVYEDFIAHYDGWLTLTRDAIDLVKQSSHTLVEREKTHMVMSFSQLQKLFQSVYYPKVLTFSIQLAQLVDALHKFTITYPLTITAFHNDHIIVAHEGKVLTMEWSNPMAIWRGHTAAKAATFLLWNQQKPLEAIAASLIDNS